MSHFASFNFLTYLLMAHICIIRLDRRALGLLHVLITEEVPVCFLFMISLEGVLFKHVVNGCKMHCHNAMHQQPVVQIQ